MKLILSIIFVIVVSQFASYLLSNVAADKFGMNSEFYNQANIEQKKQSVYLSWCKDSSQFQLKGDTLFLSLNNINSNYQRDSLKRAMITENLVNHIVPEGKDITKSFLTLIVAVLVASITFGDKIVQFSIARTSSKALIITSWIFLCLALIYAGLGLVYLMLCEGIALNTSLVNQKLFPLYVANPYYKPEYLEWLNKSFWWLFNAGLTFGISLFALCVAGIISNITKSNSEVVPLPIEEPTDNIAESISETV